MSASLKCTIIVQVYKSAVGKRFVYRAIHGIERPIRVIFT